jgi:hypothetical protein
MGGGVWDWNLGREPGRGPAEETRQDLKNSLWLEVLPWASGCLGRLPQLPWSGENISKNGPLNRRSLHYAPPDFLSRLVALRICIRLSLRRAVYVDVASSAK